MFNSIAKNAETSVNSVVNTTTRAINSGLNSVSDAADSTLTSIFNAAKNTPVINSLLPLNNSKSSNSTSTLGDMLTNAANTATNAINNTANAVVNGANSAANAVVNGANSALNNVANNAANVFTNVNNANLTMNTNSGKSGFFSPILIFIILIGVFVGLIYYFRNQIKDVCDNLMNSLGAKKDKPTPEPAPEPPMHDSPAPVTSGPDTSGLLGKLTATSGKKEVFNVSKNDFTYNDSEPMCRALGAELATYDQVMEAWKKGADWCNYGWAKGQVAVYPTQKDTFDRLQSGPEEDQGACGKPGVNGGYFDNPDLRFGVNCYGVKPAQNANDERILMEKGVIPRTPATIKMDQQAQEFKQHLGTVGVLPFNQNNWVQ